MTIQSCHQASNSAKGASSRRGKRNELKSLAPTLLLIFISASSHAQSVSDVMYVEAIVGRSKYAASENPPCATDEVTCLEICLTIPEDAKDVNIRSFFGEASSVKSPGCADQQGWCETEDPNAAIGWAAWGGPVTHRRDLNGRSVCRLGKNWSRDRDRKIRLEVQFRR